MSIDQTHNSKHLFTLIAEGDAAAFTTIFRTYYPVLYRSAFRYVKSEFWAEEIVQEVLTTVWSNREKMAIIDNPDGWLHRLTWNKAVDRIRRQEVEIKAQYALQLLVKDAGGAANVNDVSDKEMHAYREKMYRILDTAIIQLSPQRQAIYRLKYEEKLTLEEIAGRLQISRNTARNHLALAMDDIRSFLQRNADIYTVCWLCFHFF